VSIKVTVFMVTYNHEQFIAQAIESVVMQKTSFLYELVIAEDCSTDRTKEIILEYYAKYPEIIRPIFNETNIGMNNNFAKITSECSGEYIAILDGDDYFIDPNKLQKQVEFLDHNLDCVMCWHEIKVFSEYGLFESYVTHNNSRNKQTFPIENLILSRYVPTVSIMFRNNVVRSMPDWSFKLPMCDYPLFLNLAHHGNIGYVEGAMAARRYHIGGVWSMKALMYKRRNLKKYIEVYLQFNKDTNYYYDKYIQYAILFDLLSLLEEYKVEGDITQEQMIVEILDEMCDNIGLKNEYTDCNLAIFGTGKASEVLTKRLDCLKGYIYLYVDNNPLTWDKMFNGVPIKSPSFLVESKKEYGNVVVIVASMYYEEISKQLTEMGLVEDVDYFNGAYMEKFLEYNNRNLKETRIEEKIYNFTNSE